MIKKIMILVFLVMIINFVPAAPSLPAQQQNVVLACTPKTLNVNDVLYLDPNPATGENYKIKFTGLNRNVQINVPQGGQIQTTIIPWTADILTSLYNYPYNPGLQPFSFGPYNYSSLYVNNPLAFFPARGSYIIYASNPNFNSQKIDIEYFYSQENNPGRQLSTGQLMNINNGYQLRLDGYSSQNGAKISILNQQNTVVYTTKLYGPTTVSGPNWRPGWAKDYEVRAIIGPYKYLFFYRNQGGTPAFYAYYKAC